MWSTKGAPRFDKLHVDSSDCTGDELPTCFCLVAHLYQLPGVGAHLLEANTQDKPLGAMLVVSDVLEPVVGDDRSAGDGRGRRFRPCRSLPLSKWLGFAMVTVRRAADCGVGDVEI